MRFAVERNGNDCEAPEREWMCNAVAWLDSIVVQFHAIVH